MRRMVVLLVFVALAALLGCGNNNSNNTSAVTITPGSASVATNATVQFSAVLSGSPDTIFDWQVNDVSGGNLTVGTISTKGLYTAPAVIPSSGNVTVKAVSQTDTKQTTTVKVTITQGDALAVTISPTAVTVFTGHSQQFTATVNLTTNTAVNWQVNDVFGGDNTNGSITPTGLYTAPATVPTGNVVVKAVSASDSTKTASAAVTIVPAKTVVITPSSVTVPAGAQQTFTSTIDGQNATVNWSVRCQSQVAGACGSINASGVYAAPLSPPPGRNVILTATVPDNSAPASGAVINIVLSSGSLQGQYALSLSGQSSTGVLVRDGSIAFDGNGNITGGVEDSNANGSASNTSITGGTYSIGADGRGVATVQTGAGTFTWDIAVVNHNRAFVSESGGGAVTGGTLDLQDATQFTSAAIQGRYTFSVSGANTGGAAGSLAIAGALSSDGAGALSQGVRDVNSAGTLTSAQSLASGSYTVPSSAGRGTLTLNFSSPSVTQTFAYYIIDAARVRLLGTDSTMAVSGDLLKQAAAPFSTSSLLGGYAFTFSGASGSNPSARGGVFSLDGQGNITGGLMDVNTNGVFTANSFTGGFAVADSATGRFTATLSVNGVNQSYVFYPQNDGTVSFLGLDTITANGMAYPQTGSPFSNSSISGDYAARLGGKDFVANPGPEQLTGGVKPNGGSALTGTLDINSNGSSFRGTALQNNSSYGVTSASGRGVFNVTTGATVFPSASYVFYVVNGSKLLLLESDGTRLLTGTLEKQD